MDLGLKGKVALVTGAGSQTGFGKGIALTLAREGCDVIIIDKDLEGAQKTAAEIEASGVRPWLSRPMLPKAPRSITRSRRPWRNSAE